MAPKADKPTPPNAFRNARRAGVPIIAIETSDPAATIVKCTQALNGKHEITPLLKWDIVTGIKPLNNPAVEALIHFKDELPLENPVLCLKSLVEKSDKLLNRPDHNDPDRTIGAIIFMIHANRWINELDGMQSVWNARDVFEQYGITLVLLAPSLQLPPELKNDVVIISEPLPTHEELDGILTKISKDAKLSEDKIDNRETIVDTMTGTSAFGARQILAMSVTKDGIDADQLWDRKRKVIEATDGLSVWRGDNSFEDIGGLDNAKRRARKILESKVSSIRLIVFIDEIEKAIQGATGGALDGGTSADQLKVVLQLMADFKIPGIILVGHAGTGKSELAKSAGNLAKCPVINWDFGAMKAGIVGQSESRIRQAVDVIKAVSDCKCLFIATCNKIESMPPELRRRFKLGTFFCDLPTDEEQAKIWKIWTKKFSIEKQPLPECTGWTGAEIAACCECAWRTGETLREAAESIVPVIKSAPEQVKALRIFCSNRFIDASKPGIYKFTEQTQTPVVSGRKMEIS